MKVGRTIGLTATEVNSNSPCKVTVDADQARRFEQALRIFNDALLEDTPGRDSRKQIEIMIQEDGQILVSSPQV